MTRVCAAVVLGCLSLSALAESAREELRIQERPPEPAAEAEDPESAQPEPDITIIQRDDATIYEYRINGRLRAVRIVPKVGKPYYLVDTDGDGQMDKRTDDLADNMLVPSWVIYSW